MSRRLRSRVINDSRRSVADANDFLMNIIVYYTSTLDTHHMKTYTFTFTRVRHLLITDSTLQLITIPMFNLNLNRVSRSSLFHFHDCFSLSCIFSYLGCSPAANTWTNTCSRCILQVKWISNICKCFSDAILIVGCLWRRVHEGFVLHRFD